MSFPLFQNTFARIYPSRSSQNHPMLILNFIHSDSSYCVEPVGDISTYPGYGGTTTTAFAFSTDTSLSWSNLPTTTAPSYPNATTTGYPLANGSISGCFQMFNNKYGNLECGGAAKWFGVNVFDFLRWNPSLLNGQNYTLFNCHLANQTQYCASFYNQSRKFINKVLLHTCPLYSNLLNITKLMIF